MNHSQRMELLDLIAETQAHGGSALQGTSPVTVQIGYVAESNVVRHDGVVILDAPTAVLEKVIAWTREERPPSETVRASVCQYQSGPVSRVSGVLVR